MTEADHQRLSQESMILYCKVLAETGSHKIASEAVGASTDTTRKWRNRSARKPQPKYTILPDPLDEDDEPTPFHVAVDEAMKAWCDVKLRHVLATQATGYDEKVIYQGRVAYVQDTSDPDKMRIDDATGLAYWPPKLDENGEPIPLTIRKVNTPILSQVAKANIPEYRDKQEVEVTSGGKPIFFPMPSPSVEDFLKEAGSGRVKVGKPDPNS